MACGCSRRQRAAARGQTVAGYRVTLPDDHPTDPGAVIPPLGKPPLMSPAEARAIIREKGGGTARVEYV